MKIATESGATYDIVNGICYKTGHDGEKHSPFKVWVTKAVDPSAATWDEVHAFPDGPPEIGKRMLIMGKDEFWLSTVVVSIQEEIESLDKMNA